MWGDMVVLCPWPMQFTHEDCLIAVFANIAQVHRLVYTAGQCTCQTITTTMMMMMIIEYNECKCKWDTISDRNIQLLLLDTTWDIYLLVEHCRKAINQSQLNRILDYFNAIIAN